MSKTVNITATKIPVYALGTATAIEYVEGKTEYSIEILDPDSPLVHQSCDTIEDYQLFIDVKTSIKDGLWWFNDTAVSEATPKEIAIAEAYNKIRYKVKSRFELITE